MYCAWLVCAALLAQSRKELSQPSQVAGSTFSTGGVAGSSPPPLKRISVKNMFFFLVPSNGDINDLRRVVLAKVNVS